MSMSSSINFRMRACLARGNRWRGRLRTLAALGLLCRAQYLVEWIPFERWRRGFGLEGQPSNDQTASARRLAAHVERAAALLPIATKCLPRAMALSWMLRRDQSPHAIVFAVRPSHLRDAPDGLHAWVESGGVTILGDLPGPWLETLRLAG